MALSVLIDDAVYARHPMARINGISVSRLRAAQTALKVPSVESLRARLAEHGVTDMQSLVNDDRVSAWRDAIAKCGLKASRYRSSVEALARRVLNDHPVSTPVPAVNFYCAVSAAHLAPLGGYDIDRLPDQEVILRPARAVDNFAPLGTPDSSMPLTDKIMIYASGDEVLCYAYNHRDSSVTSLTGETDNAIFLGEALTERQAIAIDAAFRELEATLVAAGARVTSHVSVVR